MKTNSFMISFTRQILYFFIILFYNLCIFIKCSNGETPINITLLAGDSVQLNCTYHVPDTNDENMMLSINPTWLKADVKYNENGDTIDYKTENIIVTRKAIIADAYRDKIKLNTIENKLQTLTLLNVNAKDEGKYICRQFDSNYDKLYYVKVYVSVSGLSMKFFSSSKYFRTSINSQNNQNRNYNSYLDKGESLPVGLISSVTVRESDYVTVNCTVSVSKPAAQLSIWLSPTVRDNEMRKLELIENYVVRNKDSTMKSIAVARYLASKNDDQKALICLAENIPLEEKWKTKRVLNILYPPSCSPTQKLNYFTGINQTVEIECHMTESNPSDLDFTWNFPNSQGSMQEKTRSNGHISRITWTPRSETDFGNIICTAANSLDNGQCIIRLELGGPPNSPESCYYKENNTTTIIECKPGFHQGDREIYYYLLNKNQTGVLIEYSRKRDSCSFLISNSLLKEYENEFYIYSSNRYGDNREKATRLIIYNEHILNEMNKEAIHASKDTKQIAVVIGSLCAILLCLTVCCCLGTKCKTGKQKRQSQDEYDGYLPKSKIMESYESSNIFKSPMSTETDNYESEKLYSTIKSKDKYPTFQRREIEFLDMSPTTKRKFSREIEPKDRYLKKDMLRDAPYIDESAIYDNHKKLLAFDDYHHQNGFHNLYSFSVNGTATTDEKAHKENLWFWNSGGNTDCDGDDILNLHRNSIKYEDNYSKKHMDETNGIDLLNINQGNFGILV